MPPELTVSTPKTTPLLLEVISFKIKVPALTVVPPENVLLADSVNCPVPSLVTLPEPEIVLVTVKLLLRLKIKAPLLVTAPVPIEPVVPPEPICRVPAEIVVVPE